MTTAVIVVAKRTYGTGRLFEKNGSWHGRWRTPDGQQIQRRVGPKKEGRKEGLSKTQAETKLREMMLEHGAEPDEREAGPTVEILGQTLVANLRASGRKQSTIETVTYHLSKHIGPLLGSMPANAVNEHDVERLVKKMDRLNLSPKTQRNVIGTLHGVLAITRKRDNPCDLARLPRVRKTGVIRYLTLDEVNAVLDAPPADDAEQAERVWWPVVRLVILAGAMTGMRRGEMAGLRWHDIDFGADKVRIRQTHVRGRFDTPKSDYSVRAVPLGRRLFDELGEHMKRSPWNREGDLVFAHPLTGRPLDRVRLLGYFKRALERANVRPVRLHDLRHTFGTTVAASGQVPLRTLQEWMGHESIKTTEIYAAYMPQAHERELLDDAFAGLRCTKSAQISTTPTHNHPPYAP